MTNPPKNYHALILLVMIYLCITLVAGGMVNKIVTFGPGYMQGGAVITPLWYALSDIITEVYGYQISRQILWSALISQFIFSLAAFIIIHLPSPVFWHGQTSYNFVFGNTLRIYFSGLIAFLISGFVNIYVISKWKILIRGKYFWLRNIGSSTIAEMIYTALIIPMISFGTLSVDNIFIIIGSSYTLKIICAILLATPATLLMRYLKKIEGIDTYDYNINFNPFIFRAKESISQNERVENSTVIDIQKY